MSGIDYGMGRANIDRDSGIRYGTISEHSLSSWVMGEAEPVYPEDVEVECPECGETWSTTNLCPDDEQECPHCGHEDRYRDLDHVEPIDWDYGGAAEGYRTEHSELLCCVFFLKSPYKTRGSFCSPCAPGAVDLDSPCEDGEWAYCPGHDWFEEGKAPYPVYSVETGELVNPE